MRATRQIMGMPVTVEVVDKGAEASWLDQAFDWFEAVDRRYSTYKADSEISRINGGLPREQWSQEMTEVLELCRQTKELTNGYFDIEHNGQLDPSGLVKGWAIHEAAKLLKKLGARNFYVEAGGDLEVAGRNTAGQPWQVGIRHPQRRDQIVRAVALYDQGMATSGTYIRGQHIYDPHQPQKDLHDWTSFTVIGPNVYEADRFATAAFAMGQSGIDFIASLDGFEGYAIDSADQAVFTPGFERGRVNS